MKNKFNFLNLTALAILSFLLLSCGNKGPLYIPDTNAHSTPPTLEFK